MKPRSEAIRIAIQEQYVLVVLFLIFCRVDVASVNYRGSSVHKRVSLDYSTSSLSFRSGRNEQASGRKHRLPR